MILNVTLALPSEKPLLKSRTLTVSGVDEDGTTLETVVVELGRDDKTTQIDVPEGASIRLEQVDSDKWGPKAPYVMHFTATRPLPMSDEGQLAVAESPHHKKPEHRGHRHKED